MTTAKKEKSAKGKKSVPAGDAVSRDAMKRLMAIAHPDRKTVAEQRKLIRQLRGSLSHMKYGVDEYLAEKRKEINVERIR